ncbi:MAG: site-2 protease family protein [Candidatus Micrarchaeaceae archaeon]|jgi:Zn-dependent protease|nr:site-2 protease family protein [Candidatus Micrarchaeota archaeon]HII09882.1 site-2 protease family protein [Candidatus Micrarchaeota archaeon]
METGHPITSPTEIRDILISDIVLTLAFSLALVGGVSAFQGNSAKAIAQFEQLLPIAALAVTVNFVFHELMHKFFAQRYGAIAEFRMFYTGLIITIFTSLFGFLIGMPGATMIYTQGFTKKQNGIVSIVGPLTNLAVFGAFLAFALLTHPPTSSFLSSALSFVIEISVLLAFFNMLPIFPLDGSKVLTWSKPVYAATMGVILLLMLKYTGIGIWDILLLIVIALVISLVSRRIF